MLSLSAINNGVVRILEISNAFGLGEVVRRRNADYHCPYEPPATLIDRIFGAVEIHNNLKISTEECEVLWRISASYLILWV